MPGVVRTLTGPLGHLVALRLLVGMLDARGLCRQPGALLPLPLSGSGPPCAAGWEQSSASPSPTGSAGHGWAGSGGWMGGAAHLIHQVPNQPRRARSRPAASPCRPPPRGSPVPASGSRERPAARGGWHGPRASPLRAPAARAGGGAGELRPAERMKTWGSSYPA